MSKLLILAPDAPGDLVASRYAIAALSRDAELTVLVEAPQMPLIAGLKAKLTESIPAKFSPSLIIDMCLTPASRAVVGHLPALRMIRNGAFDDILANERELPIWDASGQTHFSILLSRYSPTQRFSIEFDPYLWKKSMYRTCKRPNGYRRIALCPGSSRYSESKRWPIQIWRNIALYYRQRGAIVVWFLGPDESALERELYQDGDEVCSGGWRSVIEAHQRCTLGVTHDTVHLHIRAFCGKKTVALFRKEWTKAWASYPGLHVTAIVRGEPSVDDVAGVLALCASQDSVWATQ